MNKEIKRTFKILGTLIALIIFIPMSFIVYQYFKNTWNHPCNQGPLSIISKCKFDQDTQQFTSRSGWWYSDAIGKLEGESCKAITDGEDKLPFSFIVNFTDRKETSTTAIYKVSCENFGQGIAGVCYAAQAVGTGSSETRYVKILIANGCNNVRYFEGSKYTIQDEKPILYDWKNPISDIPDEKTGKVTPTRFFG